LVLAVAVVGVVMLFLTPTYVVSNQPPPVEGEGSGTPITSGLLIQGAGCEVDADCVYALNAYPALRCISENCPDPSDPAQPEQGDPAYEWIDSYHETCVNAQQLNHQNSNGETLQIDSRAATCTCQAIESPDGSITSVTGQKTCRTQLTQ
ncbi:MAG: hypothetical protein AABX02_04955, partial [archaeon]